MKYNREDLRPMLATLIDESFDDPAWIFEVKWDGYRLIAAVEKTSVTLYSRNGINVTEKYRAIADALPRRNTPYVMDGELVVLDKDGVSHFQLLQGFVEKPAPLYYYAFDLLFVRGDDIRDRPLLERKAALRKMIPRTGRVRYSDHIVRTGMKFFTVAVDRGLEGIMAKRAASQYHSGKRSREWLKIKCTHEQEAIIVGYTPPRKSRNYFGSLVLAVHENGKLVYAGNCGAGFTEASLKKLFAQMSRLHAEKQLAEIVERERDVSWITPKLVCEVKFTEWTADGHMRHPVFLGLRDDKPATAVVRELPMRV